MATKSCRFMVYVYIHISISFLGEMTMSLMWYYRPEHTETEKKLNHMEDEIFASKHKDTNSVACIEDKCYVLTYSEYCR